MPQDTGVSASVTPLQARQRVQAATVLDAVPAAVLVVGAEDRVVYANPAAESLLGVSAKGLIKGGLATGLAPFSPLIDLIEQVRNRGQGATERDIALELPRRGLSCVVDVQAAPYEGGAGGDVVVVLQERTIADKLDRQFHRREAGRSVAAMAGTLAHEIRNPLSGIRGAAQLIAQNASESDRDLARLICDETARIDALIDSMEAFGDSGPMAREPLNIHEVLDRVCASASSGFARHVELKAVYDPSLPLVDGNRDALVQVFLNLVKNAAEACPARGGEIVVRTAFDYGLSVSEGVGGRRVHVPIAVEVRDNGAGIPEDLRDHLFEPFLTSKQGGKGLGLVLVAKIVAEHGGVVDVESRPGQTIFRVMLPAIGGTWP